MVFSFFQRDLTSKAVVSQEEPLDCSNLTLLDCFFENLFESTTAGYVLYGEKPVYFGSFCEPEWLMPGSKNHREALCVFLSLKALKKHTKNTQSSNYILAIKDTPNPCLNPLEFILINRKAFLEVIGRNLVLFKYKLGYDITPEKLLNNLANPNQGFSKLFDKEIALQGIALGYGVNNSISYERASTFTESIDSKNPSSPPKKFPTSPRTETEMLSTIESQSKENRHWKKVREETEDFSYYHSQHPNDALKIPFSFHKNSTETKYLFQKYRAAQSQLTQALQNKKFLFHVLQKLQIPSQTLSLEKALDTDMFPQKKPLSKLLALSIKYTFSEQISPEFLQGMKDAASFKKNASDIDFKEIEFFEILREQQFSCRSRKKKSQESTLFLQQIGRHPDVECLVFNKLYVRTLKQGNTNKSINLHSKNIKAHYHIKDLNGKTLCGVYRNDPPPEFNPEHLITGLAHGILGMNEGEIRDIYIHPDFAYGTCSAFGDGKALQIQIELIRVDNVVDNITLPPLIPIDVIHFAPEIETPTKFKELQKKYHYYCGKNVGLHYKKAEPWIHLPLVIDAIASKPSDILSEEERDIIAQLNWMIYQNQQDW